MLYVNPTTSRYTAATQGAEVDTAKRALALKELEQFFIFTLLQEMRKTIPKEGILNAGFAGEMQEEMLDDALAGEMATSGQFGIAKMIDEQIRIGEMQHQLRADGSGDVKKSD